MAVTLVCDEKIGTREFNGWEWSRFGLLGAFASYDLTFV
jgi:hypothetical protein